MSVILGESEVREKLMLSDDEFRRLASEHQNYAQELEKLSHRSYLTEDERIQEITLKKKKLLLKDRMQSRIIQFRRQLEADI
ncbi:MAG: DUF465 domain-containing protein [Acidobacteria bacterium]|nr:DUF465 domain-containing protein [Acidobacteriota bacterium]